MTKRLKQKSVLKRKKKKTNCIDIDFDESNFSLVSRIIPYNAEYPEIHAVVEYFTKKSFE